MRIRGRRRDADGNPALPSPLQFFDFQPKPPPSPPAGVGAEPQDAKQDDSSTAAIAPPSPRSSPPDGSPASSCRFCDECEDADRGEKGRYAQLSDILKGRPRRTYRSARRKFKRDKDAGAPRSAASATNKLELLCAAVCSDKELDLMDLAEECKKEENGSGSEDQGSEAKEGSSEKKSLRGRGRRTSNSKWGIDIRRQFGLQKGTRTNNCHWSYDEVNQLVEGVSDLGVGRWTELKSSYFPKSIRTAQHLKDKWRNLLIACGLQVGRKKKVDSIRITNGLRDRIIALHERHMLTRTKRRSSSSD